MAGQKLLGLIAIGFVFGILAADPSFAGPVQVNDIVTINEGTPYTGDGSGGAFAVSKGGSFLFNTFCLELNEYISMGASYKVSNISGYAYGGGVGGPRPDPISIETQYLYYRFSKGDFIGDGYNQANLQNAIWFLEEEIESYDSGAKHYVDMAKNYVTNVGSAIDSIQVMNLISRRSGTLKQSLLIRVPEPGTLILLGTGLLGLVAAGRKKFRK